MAKALHVRLADLRDIHRLANDATVGLTDLVEAMHDTIAFGKSPGGRTAGITGLVYRSVRGVTRLVGAGVDGVFDLLTPLLANRPSSKEREAIIAVLNGVLGDYLVASGNRLAIAMQVRQAGMNVAITGAALANAFPDSGRKIAVLVHGLCMNDLAWTREGHDHGKALAQDLGYTPIYLRYNSGQHISTNGREFADLMEALLHAWPQPVERLAVIGHSMGGLLARSACHHATGARHEWPKRLDDLVFLGTPHLGAPLERAGAWVDFLLGISPYTAPLARLGKIRSAGIKDLRHAHLRDEDWARTPSRENVRHPRRQLPLPAGVRCYAVAASKQARPNPSGASIRGDGLVPVNSALGRHRDAALDLALAEDRRWVGYAMSHFDLLSRIGVYERIRNWLSATPRSVR
jgi:pimeloyl-ACP methyl ester carboxylesterase